MEPATVISAADPPAAAPPLSLTPEPATGPGALQLHSVSFGADKGAWVHAADAAAAASALAWVLEDAKPSELSARRSVGIDIETTSLTPADGRIRLLQVAAGERCAVLDCFAFDAVSTLLAATAELDVDWIAHNAEFEQSWLAHHHGLTLTPMFDTRWVFVRERARRSGVHRARGSNLALVCRELLGFELSKEQRLSDWTAEPLSEAQLEYGALDALVLIPLRRELERTALAEGWTDELAGAASDSLAEARRFA